MPNQEERLSALRGFVLAVRFDGFFHDALTVIEPRALSTVTVGAVRFATLS